MDLELVTIGNELLLGFTLDTNAAEIAQTLAGCGARVVRRTTVGDHAGDIADAVRQALDRTGFVITTGGLGPTRDDITKRAVADLFDAPLDLDEDYLERLRQRFAQFGRGPMPEANRSQAEVPRGAVVLANPWGSAPGLWLERGPHTAVMIPGVPQEARGLVESQIVPRLRVRGAGRVTQSRVLRTTGISESALADALGELEATLSPVSLAYLPTGEGVDLRLTAWSVPEPEAVGLLERAIAQLRPVLAAHQYAEESMTLAETVLDLLRERSTTLATAESCTGGLIGARLTAVPGSSAVFRGGIVSYSNDAKRRLLDVPETLLERDGAVSESVAEAMAKGVAHRFGAGASVAVTGVAGPAGGSPEKPVGTVCLAALFEGRVKTVRRWFPGDREDVRRRSAQGALDLLRRLVVAGFDSS